MANLLVLMTFAFVALFVSCAEYELNKSLPPLPTKHQVANCPADKWIQQLLLPCHCDSSAPNQLRCTGQSVVEQFLDLMDYRLRFILKYHLVTNQVDKQNKLRKTLAQFDTLVVANTPLTKLDSPVFRLFPIENVILDSDHLLRRVNLVDSFGKRNSQQKVVQLDNLYIANMDNVSFEE